jgi:hypothetical protein
MDAHLASFTAPIPWQGVGDILRDEDTVFGEAGEALPGAGSETTGQADALEITIDHIEARLMNRTAGV